MPKEKITVDIAGVKLNLITSSGREVMRMANSLDASVRRKMKKTSGMSDVALVLLLLEQTEALKKNTALIHSQQEQIFSLYGEKQRSSRRDAGMRSDKKSRKTPCWRENEKLREEIDRLCDEDNKTERKYRIRKGNCMKGLPELLAPAGSSEAVSAAIKAGADAVYVGG